jgi:hypothetical protein
VRDRRTQAELILAAMQEAGDKGVTNLDLNKICFRYGGRIFDLREQGHNIVTINEGKGVFRFVLKPRIQPVQLALMEQVTA